MPVTQTAAAVKPKPQNGIGREVGTGVAILLVCGAMVLQRYLFDGDELSGAGHQLLNWWKANS
jgi:hypothetical protein